MAYTIISQNNTTTTLSDENGNVITVPARVTLATSTDYTIKKVNNNNVDLESGDGKIIRGVPACVVLAGEGGGGGGGDQHNLGYYATQAALEEAHPTAEAGDWAIVGATDTVWIWDTDNSAWVDSDQKGQVTSVNGQTGEVSLSIPDAVQYSTMPTASADNLGDIVQFTGTTDANYTNGYFYKCVSDGQDPATYSWEAVEVQAGGGGSYTAGTGIDITNDVISVTDPVLVNKATGTGSVSIHDSTRVSGAVILDMNPVGKHQDTVVVGYNCQSGGTGSVIIGRAAGSSNSADVISIGKYAGSSPRYSARSIFIGSSADASSSYKTDAIAIGYKATIGGSFAIQLGTDGANGYNNPDANTFKVGNSNGNFEIMSADGTVPTARLTKVNTTATLAAGSANWTNNEQTVTVSGVKADSVVFVSPAPASASDYASAGISCTAQAADSLTFTCTTTPTNAITVNVVCM